MRRASFFAAGGAAALAGCGHATQMLPNIGASYTASASMGSALAKTNPGLDDPARPLPKYPILGEVRRFDGKKAPPGWSLCDGSILAIAANKHLFSILGTSAGGDGKKTFALPKSYRRLPLVICTSGEFITSP